MRIRQGIAAILTLVLMGILFPRDAQSGYKPDHPEYTRLTSRALGMGGACVAWIDDGSAIFQNPAGLGRINSLSISHAHSRNHFPGPISNLDQIDCDPTSFIVPLSGLLCGYPLGSAGAGWLLQGEMGYDYTVRNDPSIPREHLWGMEPIDRSEGAGFRVWPGGFVGFTHRINDYLFADGGDLPLENAGVTSSPPPQSYTWRRSGEGGSVGLQQTVFPGIDFGAVVERMDYDYLPARDGITGERTNSVRTGWCFRPTAWLTIARDTENLNRKEWPSKDVVETVRVFWGTEIKLGPWFSVRCGSLDGHKSSGWSYAIGPWRSDSASVEGFMPEMVREYPEEWQDIHFTGFNLGW